MTAKVSFALFETAIGLCTIAWNGQGDVVALQLPEGSRERAQARLLRRFREAAEAAPPAKIAAAVEAITALLAGEPRDLTGVTLDLDALPEFNRRVYAVARGIPPGRTLTYGDIAKALGDPLLARDVGQALGKNPFPIVVPCHRVVAAGGKLGGFSARGGNATKRRMLLIEQARTGEAPDLFG